MKCEEPLERVTAAEIAEDIDRTRVRLSRSLAKLDREYALRNLLVHALRRVLPGEGTLRPMAATLRQNIVPYAMIGLGFAWLLQARSSDDADLGRRASQALSRLEGFLRELGLYHR